MHQRIHDVTINVEHHYVMVRCGDDVRMYDEIPDYCSVCNEAL